MNQFLERLLHISVYPSPLWGSEWVSESSGGAKWWAGCLESPQCLSSIFSLLHYTDGEMKGGEAEGRGGGGGGSENVSQEPGAVSDFCSPAVWPKSNYLSLEPSSRLWSGDNDSSCCVSGLWPWLPEEMYVGKMRDKCGYTLVGAEIGSCTCVTCVI